MPIKAIIIDDERLARIELKKLLQDFSDILVIDEAANVDEGVEKIELQNPDLIFLDIQMPGLTGLQFIKSFPQKCMYIFTTAYEKYALEGYHLNVVDYLLKPVSLDRFVQACTKALELSQLKNKSSVIPAGAQPSYFFYKRRL